MTEPRKESLSALIDDEASDIEVHRLVREFQSDESLTASWAVYQHVRSTVRGKHTTGVTLDPARHEALFRRISASVALEDAHQQSKTPIRERRIVVGSLALAASLVVAVFIGVGQPADPVVPNLVDVSVPVQSVASDSFMDQNMAETQELIELDEDRQRQLRAYLNQHDRMARMNVNRQFVNYNNETPGK